MRIPQAFKNVMRMAPEMYAEIMGHVEHRITKQFTRLQQPMERSLKLAVSGANYSRASASHHPYWSGKSAKQSVKNIWMK